MPDTSPSQLDFLFFRSCWMFGQDDGGAEAQLMCVCVCVSPAVHDKHSPSIRGQLSHAA